MSCHIAWCALKSPTTSRGSWRCSWWASLMASHTACMQSALVAVFGWTYATASMKRARCSGAITATATAVENRA